MTENGFEVIMVSTNDERVSTLIQREKSRHFAIPFTRVISPIKDLLCLAQLIRLVLAEKPDIIHTHTPKAGLLGMLAAKICRVPHRIHTVAGLPFMTAVGLKKKLLINVEKLTYWSANQVWPNSNSMLKVIDEGNLCPSNKLNIIANGSSNGIDLSVFSREKVTAERLIAAKEVLSYKEDVLYLLAIGRIVNDKGIIELLEAFQQLSTKFEAVQLVLVGPLEYVRSEESLSEDLVTTIRSNPRITHVSWTDDVPAFLALANVLIHASHREGFPNVPLQAGAMECPVVCSDIPGNIDIVENDVTGRLFPVGDSQRLTEAVLDAIAEPEKNQKMVKELRAQIENQFSRPFIQKSLLKRYHTLLGTAAEH
jgi:glycosyltransferase involved in cell wall biosynthesis